MRLLAKIHSIYCVYIVTDACVCVCRAHRASSKATRLLQSSDELIKATSINTDVQFSSISFIFKFDWGPIPSDARPLLASQCGSLYPDPFALPPVFGRRGTDHLP